ncbi:regenerating islet-derived protein 4-like [Anolis sagrei]|uniref:regenerating islet-derived protein 4-like n=1 Tax=Anolis sagrei TaxID=38937 RepID=UPI00351FA0BF
MAVGPSRSPPSNTSTLEEGLEPLQNITSKSHSCEAPQKDTVIYDSKGVEMGTVFLCFSVTIFFFLQGTEAGDCPKEWKIYKDVCYGVIQTSETWSDAEVDCQSRGLGGHLASILGQSEVAMIAGMIRHGYPDVKELWVGLQDPRQTNRWQWSDSNPFNFRAWSPWTQQTYGHCAYISSRSGFKELEKGFCTMAKAYLCKSTM